MRNFKTKPIVNQYKDELIVILNTCINELLFYPKSCVEYKKIQKQIEQLQEKINKKS